MTVQKLREGVEIFTGTFDESIKDFLPKQKCWQRKIDSGESTFCLNHPLELGEKEIKIGDQVVALKWQAGIRDGQPFWRVYFYCSTTCQKSHKFLGNYSPKIKTPAGR